MTNDSSRFRNQTAIVTGAGAGIGKVIALDFLKSGAQVAAVGIRAPKDGFLDDFREYGRRFLWIRANVSREAEVRRAVQQVIRKFGRVDILVNNAGIRGTTAPVIEQDAKDWREVLEVNLTGAFLFARECAKDMMKRRQGRIINMSSIAGRMAYALRAPYAASKWGLIGFTVTLAQELGPYNVLVNVICPGPVEGANIERVIAERARVLGVSVQKARELHAGPAILGRMVSPQDVSQTVLFLCSEAARSITGQAINVCGGYKL